MAQNITLLGASYSDVPSVELPKTGGGTASFTDVTDTTATAADVLQGKYFYLANGTKVEGSNAGGSGDGYVWQDAQGYVHLSDEEGTQPIVDSLTVSGSGTYTAQTGHVYNPVIVPSGSATPASSISATGATVSTGTNTLTLSKTVSNTPSVSAGYISSGTSGNSSVSLTASVNTRSSSDLTASGATVTAPAGYYSSSASKSVSSGTASPASTISATGATVSTGSNTITLSKSVSNTPTVSAGYISSGTAGNSSVSLTASVNTRSSSDLTASGATVTAPAGYYSSGASKTVDSMTLPTSASSTGAGTLKATISSSTSIQYINIPTGYNSANACYQLSAPSAMTLPTTTSGTSTGTLKATVTPSTANKYINIPTGYNSSNAYYTVSGDANLVASNIKNGTTIFGVQGSYTGGGGGATLITGTFTTGSTRATTETTTISYSGSGFPMSIMVYASSTANLSNYDIGTFSAIKNTSVEPSYTTATDVNNRTTSIYLYRNSSLMYGANPQTTTFTYMSNQYTPASGHNCVKFVGNGTTLGYYIGNNTNQTAGLSPNMTYSYIIVYSE